MGSDVDPDAGSGQCRLRDRVSKVSRCQPSISCHPGRTAAILRVDPEGGIDVRPDEETCWTLIRAVAAGNERDRETFARVYQPVVRAYLGARWTQVRTLRQEIDDAVQEGFIDCLRPGGALERYDSEKGRGFRAFLYGIVRNVARRVEQRRARIRTRQEDSKSPLAAQPVDDESLGAAFDRSWARAILREAARRQRDQAAERGDAAIERVQLLELRFNDGLSIREIARRWETDPARLHHVYATARKEFRRVLESLVNFHSPDATSDQVRNESDHLLELVG